MKMFSRSKIINAIACVMTTIVISASVSLALPNVKVSADDKKIEEIFEDVNLQAWIKENVDTDKNGYISQAEADSVTELHISNQQISSISGLEIFTNMTILDCSSNEITKFDASLFPQVKYLNLSSNKFETLNVISMSNLEQLICDNNKLTILNVSRNKKLDTVSAENNGIVFFNPGSNNVLRVIQLDNNKMEEIPLEKLPNLESLFVKNNELKYLDVTMNTKLEWLDCSKNSLPDLVLSSNPELEHLDCTDCNLEQLDLRQNKKISILFCSDNKLSSLNTDELVDLYSLSCWGQSLKLDLSKNVKLTYLSCKGLPGSFDISNLPALQNLHVYNSEATSMSICNLPSLKELSVENGNLTKLEISSCAALKTVYCRYNDLTSLDLSDCKALEELRCNENKLTSLDISKNEKLKVLFCEDNLLTSLDISKNKELQTLGCTGNKLKNLSIVNNPTLLESYKNSNQSTDKYKYYAVPWGYNFKGFKCDADVEIITTAPSTPVSPSTTGGTFEDFVERLYVVALGRASEADGKAHWCKVVGNGSYSGADCARFFLTSPEFNGRNLNDEEYLKVLYKTFFDRDAASDPDGFNFWLGKIGEWGRARVLEGFIDSTEWCNICADYGVRSGAMTAKATKASKNATAFASRLYTECLGREPEEGGLNYWSLSLTNQERTGTQAAKEFFYSPEFKDKNLGDEEYVNRLYKTFMGREPEAEGKAYWLEQLGNGSMNRDQVFDFFSTCEEFTGICNSYAIAR